MIRPAREGDAAEIAALHVAAWRETYPGLLPAETIASVTLEHRREVWTRALAAGTTRIWLAEGAGFAQAGPQREPALAADWPGELWAMYLLRAAQGRGLGRRLLTAVRPAGAFTACVVEGNDRACGFYAATGGRMLLRRPTEIRGAPTREILYGWDGPLPGAVAGGSLGACPG